MKVVNVFNVILIALFLWVFISWVDVVSDNTTSNPQHSDLNFFCVFFEEETL